MRKYMTKDVTQTEIKCGRITLKEGEPILEVLDSIFLFGDISKKKAQQIANKKYGSLVQVFDTVTTSRTYKMLVTEFIKVAELVTDGENLEEELKEEENE